MIRTKTNYIVIHCSATRRGQDIGLKELKAWHTNPPKWVWENGRKVNKGGNGWSNVGYHIIIRRDGSVEYGRPINEVGAHVAGFNSESVGVVLIGGLGENGRGENNFTPAQFKTLAQTIRGLRGEYSKAAVCGHRDLSPDINRDGKISPNEWVKECPSFDVASWLKTVGL